MTANPLVLASMTRGAWAAVYSTVLDAAEELADAGNLEAVVNMLAWPLPVLGAASADLELQEREERLREACRVYLDDSVRQLIEAAVTVLEPHGQALRPLEDGTDR